MFEGFKKSAIFNKVDIEKSSHIILRAVEPSDIDILYKWENDRSIWEVSNTITPFSRYVLAKYIESAQLDIYQTRQLRLMIDFVSNDNPITIGAVDLFDFDPYHLRAGIGILIGDKSERGKGYANSALKELLKYVFEILKLNQVYCNILTSNQASINLFQKHGFRPIGVKKSWVKMQNEFSDELMLQCFNPEPLT